MERIVVVGNSGSGKTTLARLIAAVLVVPCLELDAVFHLPDWGELPIDEFRQQVSDFVVQDRWVMDGNYSSQIGNLAEARADTIVWLDLSRATVMRQVVARTVRRVVTREELWNGNREPWTNLYRWTPETSIIRWAWTQHAVYRQRYAELAASPRRGVSVVRLTSRRQVAAWIHGVSEQAVTRKGRRG